MVNNKDTDAAMEAAWRRFRAQPGNLHANERNYRAGWSDGYNAAMNRECVWTWKGTDHYRSGCGWIQPFITKFCNTCGGKVSSGEEKNDE